MSSHPELTIWAENLYLACSRDPLLYDGQTGSYPSNPTGNRLSAPVVQKGSCAAARKWMNRMPEKLAALPVSPVYLLTSPGSLGLRQPHPA